MLSYRRIFWIFGVIFVLLVIFLPGYTKLQELKDKKREIDSQISKVEADNARLKNEISRIEHDPVYRERVIREKFGVVRKGEVIYKMDSQE